MPNQTLRKAENGIRFWLQPQSPIPDTVDTFLFSPEDRIRFDGIETSRKWVSVVKDKEGVVLKRRDFGL